MQPKKLKMSPFLLEHSVEYPSWTMQLNSQEAKVIWWRLHWMQAMFLFIAMGNIPPAIPLPVGVKGSWPPLKQCAFGPQQSPPRMQPQSVQLFLHSAPMWLTDTKHYGVLTPNNFDTILMPVNNLFQTFKYQIRQSLLSCSYAKNPDKTVLMEYKLKQDSILEMCIFSLEKQAVKIRHSRQSVCGRRVPGL